MLKINKNYQNVKQSYLFSTIAKKTQAFLEQNPQADIIRMGIGDVKGPLPPAVTKAMEQANREMATEAGFHGYGPEQGYAFLKQPILQHYAEKGVTLSENEVFISDGAKSDIGNILDLFDRDNTVLIPDPVYPVYVDTNIMDGRKIVFMDANEQNGFLPLPGSETKGDIIYLCSPNNPTGAVYSREQLKLWVDFALKNQSVILFDAAYEVFVQDAALPTSIFEIPGAEKCAIEFCSFSKTAGFTGTRCGYTVVPNGLEFEGTGLQGMWLRRQTTKFNGVSYPVQVGAAAVFTKEGMEQVRQAIAYYKENAKIICAALDELGISYTGGKNSPYVWLKCPGGMKSWDFFDLLLQKANVVGTPGEGFGKNGEGFFRLTAFGNRERTVEAMARIQKALK